MRLDDTATILFWVIVLWFDLALGAKKQEQASAQAEIVEVALYTQEDIGKALHREQSLYCQGAWEGAFSVLVFSACYQMFSRFPVPATAGQWDFRVCVRPGC